MPERRRKEKPRIDVDLVRDAGDWSALPDAEELVTCAADQVATLSGLVKKRVEVSVVLSSNANIAALNGQFRGKPKPTNVLSFPAGPGAAADYLGDIVLAHETIVREAHEQDTSLEHHLQHLVVHGLLHLLGFDHEIDADAERMEKLEIKILAGLGIANPYTAALDTAKRE